MTQDKPPIHRILIIDDNTAIHEDFRKILMCHPKTDTALDQMESLLFGDDRAPESSPAMVFEIGSAYQGQEGVDMAARAQEENRPFSLAFVDGRMPPGWDGIQTICHLWKACPELQIVLCTAYADFSWKKIREVLGDSDNLLILKKPFDNVEVLQMAHALTRKWEMSREIKGRLNRLAFSDHLTGLPNRTMLLDKLEYALGISNRYQQKGALLFIDLDGFKRINDSLGHSMGDQLIKTMGQRLQICLRATDTVSRAGEGKIAARLGGDEFIVLLPRIETQNQAAKVARRITEYISQPVSINQNELIITPSIGVAIFPDDGKTSETLLKNADLAMYFAKETGPGNFKYFTKSMNASAQRRLAIESQLGKAVKKEEVHLYYQPQVELSSGKIIGFEALIRWDNQELGSVSPVEFIPVAEDSGLIISIGEWVLRTACTQACKWMSQGLPFRRIAVNVSINQFTHPNFIGMVADILRETGLPGSCLEIEITESLLAQDTIKISKVLSALKFKKIRISLDDFGTGYSSLSRLKEMPIDCLKIDRSFISGMDHSHSDKSIIGAIISMAEAMGLEVIAEGVETQAQADFLVEKSCTGAQGYFFSRPLPWDQLRHHMRTDFNW